jgi:DNA invertase Pin-like site-specific DNA recombinase
MSASERIKATHLQRCAYVYVRQSTASQVQHNRESTNRQYKLGDRALRLGWPKEQIKTIDEDLARSGSSTSARSGFTRMTTEVALGHVGLILSTEVSRVARNNADWYRLLDLCGVTDTLIGDEDGLYHPGLFNDRLLLGLKGTMAEAELHVIRARLEGGIRYGKTRQERFVDPNGRLQKRIRRLSRSQWAVLLQDHHKGLIDWATTTMNQRRIASNTHPAPHQATGAIREGAALLQGLATCGRCGRRLMVYYQGRCSTPGYYCTASTLVNGRGCHCMRIGGVQIDEAVTRALLDAIAPAGIQSALLAEEKPQADHEASLKQWRLQVERARYEAEYERAASRSLR